MTDPAPSHAPDWATLDAALDAALDLDGPDRDAYVASLDSATRAALFPLLRDALREDTLLDHPRAVLASLAADGAADGAARVAEGVRVGPYRIEQLVGEGGMGRVYRARRADGAFDRTVALKVVRQSLALAGADVAARLRRERDLLATLDHPGIARLLDGGETDDGVPYLVTEFVDGAPITQWATAQGLGVRQRVRLMAEVARAVDHAHRRFVVHRDLKPSNVLVTEADGAPRPVVLDFGIAKLLDEAEDAGSAAFPLTRTGMRLLTPAYAAPELYEPTATVTTAADVYGLGALLYELLTGHRPHDDAPDRPGPPTTEPTRPSRVVTASGGAFDPARRSRQLSGDLDVICLQALHPDPARRYERAADLADDLQRFLDGRPVEARPDSLGYVVGRFVRRHRAAVAAGVVALAALIGGLGTALVSLSHEREARAESEVQARRATEAADLLAGILRTADPDYDEGRTVTVAEAVEQGVARVRRVQSDPLRAYLLRVLGETYVRLGEPVTADSLLWEALSIHEEDATNEEATLIRRQLLATQDALSNPERVLALARRLQQDDPDDVVTPLFWMSRAYSALGRHRQAVASARRARDAVRGGPAEKRVRAESQLGEALAFGGHAEQALPYLEEAVRMSVATFGRESGRTSDALTSLGQVRGEAGDVGGAEEALRAAMDFHARRYGANRIGYPMAYLGVAKLRAGQPQAAAMLLDSAIAITAPIIGADHQDIGWWLQALARAHNQFGDHEAAERAARRSLAIAEATGSEPLAAQALSQLGLGLAGRDPGAARAALQRAARLLAKPTERASSYREGSAETLREVRGALATLGARG